MYLKGKSQTFQDVQYTEPLLLKDNAALLFRDTLPFIFIQMPRQKWPLEVDIITCIKRCELLDHFSTDRFTGPARFHLLMPWGKLASLYIHNCFEIFVLRFLFTAQ